MKTLSQKLSFSVFVMATVLSSMVNAMTPQEAKVAFLEMNKDLGAMLDRVISPVGGQKPVHSVRVDFHIDGATEFTDPHLFRHFLADQPHMAQFMVTSGNGIADQQHLLDRRIQTVKALGRNLVLIFDVMGTSIDSEAPTYVDKFVNIKWRLIDRDTGQLVSSGSETNFADTVKDNRSSLDLVNSAISKSKKALNREIARLKDIAVNKVEYQNPAAQVESMLERLNPSGKSASLGISTSVDRYTGSDPEPVFLKKKERCILHQKNSKNFSCIANDQSQHKQ